MLVAPQTAIQTDGFRSLADGEDVEFFEEIDANGRKKAVRVTGPGKTYLCHSNFVSTAFKFPHPLMVYFDSCSRK